MLERLESGTTDEPPPFAAARPFVRRFARVAFEFAEESGPSGDLARLLRRTARPAFRARPGDR